MKCSITSVKNKVNFLLFIVILSSCTASTNYNSTIVGEDKMAIIKTKEGFTYYVPWFEVKDGYATSILNTSKVVLDKGQINQLILLDPFLRRTVLDSALIHDGPVIITTIQPDRSAREYRFIKLREYMGQIVGYKKTGEYTANIVIPIDQIKDIDVELTNGTQDCNPYVLDFFLIATEIIFWDWIIYKDYSYHQRNGY